MVGVVAKMKENNICIITNKTKGKLPSLPFVSIKNAILGEDYDLSIAFIGSQRQRTLNKTYRNLDKTTNILSFPLTKSSGQITLDINKIKKEAPMFKMPFNTFLKFLIIHGCLHLKGFDHSSIMEKEEEKFLELFS